MERIILDTDTAGDDNIAILFALRSSNAVLEAITINCGNINFDQQVENALYTCEFAAPNKYIPVYPGCRRPILKDWTTVENVHGKDGMGDSNFPKPTRRPEKKHAIDAIIDIINDNPGEITFVEIAPMTNLALALRKDPGIAKKVKRFIFMGGTNQYLGNVTPAAEFNIWVDPDAAKIVLHSGLHGMMVGWEICMRYGIIDSKQLSEIDKMKTKESEFFLAVNRQVRKFMKTTTGIDCVTCPDSITMAIVLNEKVATDVREKYVDVENSEGLARGATFVDELNILGKEPNARVVYSASSEIFKDMLYRVLSGKTI